MKTDKIIERPDLRPSKTGETPQERAARRTAELRGHNNASIDEGVDKFATPTPPEGWSYEWKVKAVMGYVDSAYLSKMARSGWEPVEIDRHPEMMQKGATGAIERDGMVLCERPLEITEDMRARDIRMARQQVATKEAQLTSSDGLLGRDDSRINPKLKKGYEPIPMMD